MLRKLTTFAQQNYNDGIQMIDKPKYIHTSFKDGKILQIKDIPDQALPNILRLLGEPEINKMSDQNKPFAIYTSFYIDPTSTWTGIWDFILIFITYFFQVEISLLLAFGPDFWTKELNSNVAYIIAYSIQIVFLLVDMFICFHKGYYAFGRGRVINDHRQIIKHYLKIHFPIDLVAIIFLIIPLLHSDYFLNYLQLVPAVLLYIKKAKNQRQILGMLQYHRTFRNVIQLSILGCDVMLMGHYGACIFVGLDLLLWRLQYYGDNTAYYWLINDSSYSVDLIDGPWILQYVFAQSFSTGTLSTLAPGPFGKNPIQIFYAIILMTFFMILASYVGQVLMSILVTTEQIRIFHQNNIQRFDQFMKLKGVSNRIKQRVHNFFELVWEVEGKLSLDKQKQILGSLPLTLKEQLMIQMGFTKHLHLFDFFTNGKTIQRLISFKITSVVIDAETTIIFAGRPPSEIDQRYMYHIKKGLCKFFQVKSGLQEQVIALSNIKKTVGQFEFMTGLAYTYSCKSIDLCVIDKIANADLIQIMSTNGILQEYHVLKYRLLVENQLHLISKSCMVCEGNHSENACTDLFPSQQVKEQFHENGGIINMERKPFRRNTLKGKKVLGIDPNMKFSDKAMIPMMWVKFQKLGLGNMVIGLSKFDQFDSDQVRAYQSFYPNFNI